MRVLFVCLGNICRSPAGEAVMKSLLRQHALDQSIIVDSAGTADYHSGEEPDTRMRQALSERGYTDWSPARQVQNQDFEDFDWIIAMDQQNLRQLQSICPDNRHLKKIRLASDFLSRHPHKEIPDPYYGTKDDFELVIQLAEDFCQGIIQTLKAIK